MLDIILNLTGSWDTNYTYGNTYRQTRNIFRLLWVHDFSLLLSFFFTSVIDSSSTLIWWLYVFPVSPTKHIELDFILYGRSTYYRISLLCFSNRNKFHSFIIIFSIHSPLLFLIYRVYIFTSDKNLIITYVISLCI